MSRCKSEECHEPVESTSLDEFIDADDIGVDGGAHNVEVVELDDGARDEVMELEVCAHDCPRDDEVDEVVDDGGSHDVVVEEVSHDEVVVLDDGVHDELMELEDGARDRPRDDEVVDDRPRDDVVGDLPRNAVVAGIPADDPLRWKENALNNSLTAA